MKIWIQHKVVLLVYTIYNILYWFLIQILTSYKIQIKEKLLLKFVLQHNLPTIGKEQIVLLTFVRKIAHN